MYNMMFVTGTVLAVIFLIISIFLCFRNNVPKLLGGLTGQNTKRTIRKMQQKDKMNTLEIETDEKNWALSGNNEMEWMAEEEVTLKLCSENETSILLEEQIGQVPAIFEVLEDIVEFHNY